MKNSWKQWNAALLILMSAAILAMWFFIHNVCNGDGREGGSDKHEWSLMQVIESRNGNQAIRHPGSRSGANAFSVEEGRLVSPDDKSFGRYNDGSGADSERQVAQ